MTAENETGSEIAEIIAHVVQECNEYGIDVVSVNTDNAANNKAALNGDDDSAQALSNSHFIRQPCSAHTCNLTLEDMFLRDPDFGFVSDCIDTLIKNAPPTVQTKPKYKTIRWISLHDCVKYIQKESVAYLTSENPEVLDAYNHIEETITWDYLAQMLDIMKKFLLTVEKDLTSIAEIIPPLTLCCVKLDQLGAECPAALTLLMHFKARFTETCSLQLPCAAYLFTKDGLDFYRKNPDFQELLSNTAIAALPGYMQERCFPPNMIEPIIDSFIQYLLYSDFSNFSNIQSFEIWKNEHFEINPMLRNLAIEVLSIPSSEAAVEQLFRFFWVQLKLI